MFMTYPFHYSESVSITTSVFIFDFGFETFLGVPFAIMSLILAVIDGRRLLSRAYDWHKAVCK